MLESALFSWVIGIFFLLAIVVLIFYTVGFETFLPRVMIRVDAKTAVVVDNILGKDFVLNEGFHYIIPFIHKVERTVSLKEQASDPDPQMIITEDNISITVDMIAMIKIVDPMKAVMEVEDYENKMVSLVQTSVVDIMGTKKLKEIQTQLGSISDEIIEHIETKKKTLENWGIQVTQVEFESIKYSDDIQKSMEQITIAQNKKKAMITEAEAKKEAAQREAEALLHKIETIKKSMNQIPDEKILEFLKSMDYINSMQSLSSSSNAKFVLYPSGDQQAVDKIMRTEYLSQSMDKNHRCYP